MKKILLSLAVAILVTVSCSEEKVPFTWGDHYTSLKPSNVGEEASLFESKVLFNPPEGWVLFDSKLSRKRNRGSQSMGSSKFSVIPLKLYYNSETKSVLTISTVEIGKQTSHNKLDYIKSFKNYKISEQSFSLGEELSKDFSYQFIKLNGVEAVHLIEGKPNLKTYNVIQTLNDSTLIHFNYSVRENKNDIEKSSVFSSISTIRFNFR